MVRFRSMAADNEAEWTVVYETPSASDADLVRTTLEVAGYRVSIQAATARDIFRPGPEISVAVPTGDAEDARDFLKLKTGLLPRDDAPAPTDDESSAPLQGVADVALDIMKLRREHEVAACKYCGIPTLDLSESELDSRTIALLRAAGLGVNSATFSEFEPGERICTDCAGHEVACEICGRVLDAYLDRGEYRRANDDEAYVCSVCRGQLEDQLQATRDW
jgi:hypothetical protein